MDWQIKILKSGFSDCKASQRAKPAQATWWSKCWRCHLTNEAKTGLINEDVNVSELVKDTVLRFLNRADSLGVDLGVRGYELNVIIKSQRSLLEGALNNLIDNALRYGVSETQNFNQITIDIAKSNLNQIEVLRNFCCRQWDWASAMSTSKHQVMRRRAQGEAI
jgi:signal transduction histidine kinase